jgi:hypothetical protein
MGTDTLIDVMLEVFITPKSLQSNYVRDHSYEMARLASIGLVSTGYPTPSGEVVYGHHWRLTHKGLRLLTSAGAA